MSRTYRKRTFQHHICDVLTDWFCHEDEVVWEDTESVKMNHSYGGWSRTKYYTVVYDRHSPTGKKLLARGRRDEVIRFKEPGPSWFRNMFEERPLRRNARRELQRFMTNEEYEPIIDPKPRKKIYWT